ncbi:hypothetical protein MRX96_036206 [Rhipicephalus microplus]
MRSHSSTKALGHLTSAKDLFRVAAVRRSKGDDRTSTVLASSRLKPTRTVVRLPGHERSRARKKLLRRRVADDEKDVKPRNA